MKNRIRNILATECKLAVDANTLADEDDLYAAGLTIVATLTLVLYSLSRLFLPVSWSFVSSFTFLGVALQLSIFNYALPYSYPGAYSVLLIVLRARPDVWPRADC